MRRSILIAAGGAGIDRGRLRATNGGVVTETEIGDDGAEEETDDD